MTTDKPTPESIRQLLAAVRYPGFPRDIVSLGMVADVAARFGALPARPAPEPPALRVIATRTDPPAMP